MDGGEGLAEAIFRDGGRGVGRWGLVRRLMRGG